jgi:hypothetical protein
MTQPSKGSRCLRYLLSNRSAICLKLQSVASSIQPRWMPRCSQRFHRIYNARVLRQPITHAKMATLGSYTVFQREQYSQQHDPIDVHIIGLQA